MNDRRLTSNLEGFVANAERHPRGGRQRRVAIKNARAFAAEAQRRGLDTSSIDLRLNRLRPEVSQTEEDEQRGWLFGKHRTVKET